MSESRTFWLWQDITGRRGGRVISIPFYTTSFFLFLFPIFYFVFFFFLVVVVLPGLCHNSSRAPASSPLSFLYQTRANIKKKEKEKRIRRERENGEEEEAEKDLFQQLTRHSNFCPNCPPRSNCATKTGLLIALNPPPFSLSLWVFVYCL